MKNTPPQVMSGIVAIFMTAVAASAQAAYPKSIQLNIQMWNQTGMDLALSAASWAPTDTDYSAYGFSAKEPTASVSITLKKPRNDSASFRVSGEGKICEFRAAHETTFDWFSLNPAPQKSATGKSVGTVPAECTATVIKGTNAMKAYSVRFVMK
jgi:hypothetical protein